MKKKLKISFLILIIFPFTLFAQRPDISNNSDSLNKKKDSIERYINTNGLNVYDANTKLTLKNYCDLLGNDLKKEFTKPFHMTRLDWEKFGKFTTLFIAVSFADEPVQKFSARLTNKEPALKNISKYVTRFGGKYETITLATIAGAGVIFKKQKMITTTLLATQAYLTGGILESVIKYISGKTRPSYYSTNEEAEPKFLGPFSNFKDANGKRQYSFPSGHATIAFAAATVFALEYKDKIYIPIIAYSAATLVGISRVTENKHWASDVLTGAAIGYLAGKNVIANYHQFEKLKTSKLKKNSVAFNLQYIDNQFVPEVIYKFK